MKNIFFVIIAIVALAFSRWMPHAPNFTPLLAMSLWLGSQKLAKKTSAIILISSLLLSDWVLGFHDLMPVVYGSLLIAMFAGDLLKNKNYFAWMTAGLISSVFFFITTNLAVWYNSGLYPRTTEGLVECFTLAIPFFHNVALSTWIFSGVLVATQKVLGIDSAKEQVS